jgi:hypothetical protein
MHLHRSIPVVLVMLVAAGLGGCADPAHEQTREADRWLGVDRRATFAAHVELISSMTIPSAAGLARLGTRWEDEPATMRIWPSSPSRTASTMVMPSSMWKRCGRRCRSSRSR